MANRPVFVQLLFFQFFKAITLSSGFHCLSDKKTDLIVIIVALYVIRLFSYGCFQCFFFIFDFQQFDYDGLRYGCVFKNFCHLWVFELLVDGCFY